MSSPSMQRLWHATKADRALGLRARPIPVPSYEEGYAAGVAQGRATVEAELASDRAALSALVASIEGIELPPQNFAAAIDEIAARLAIAAAGSAAIDRALLTERAQATAAALAHELPPLRLCFHIDDLELIEIDALPCPVVAVSDIARGSVRAEAGEAWASDGLREAIDRIVRAAGL